MPGGNGVTSPWWSWEGVVLLVLLLLLLLGRLCLREKETACFRLVDIGGVPRPYPGCNRPVQLRG